MRTDSNNTYTQPIPAVLFIDQFAKVLGMPKNKNHARRILCAFCQTFRVRVPLIASSALVAHLPKEIKQLYKNGWNRKCCPHFDYDEFINALFEIKGVEHLQIFSSKAEAEKAVSAVFEVLKAFETERQYSVTISFMPLLLRVNLVKDYVFEGYSYFI